MMKKIGLAALFVLVFSVGFESFGHERPDKLPGRKIAIKQLPDTVRRFITRYCANVHRFTYRRDRRFYYACDEAGGYYLFSASGAMKGFRFNFRQPSRQIVELLPAAAIAHIREHYLAYSLGAFLPEGEGCRAELFGADDRTLRFDSEGRFLREEGSNINRTVSENKTIE